LKDVQTVAKDILSLFEDSHIPVLDDPDFGGIVGREFRNALDKDAHKGLRLSGIGNRYKHLWYDVNQPDAREQPGAVAKVKFLYGHLLEALLLHLAREAGHEVTREQETVYVDGVPGHIDCVMDHETVVDVKSANSRSFERFVAGLASVADDVFLVKYLYQLASYSDALGGFNGGFLVIDKVLGKLHYLHVPKEYLADLRIRKRVADVKDMVSKPEPPDEECPTTAFGQSGNRVLAAPCTYCPYKDLCCKNANGGKGLRSFRYANGIKHFTHVEREPDVFEIKRKQIQENSDE
jgi:hypothetical protein